MGAGLHPSSSAGATKVGSSTAKIAALEASPQASMAHVTACFHIYFQIPSAGVEVVDGNSQDVMVRTVQVGGCWACRRGCDGSNESENWHEQGGHSSFKHRKAELVTMLEPTIVDVACRLVAPRAALSIE